MAHNDVFQGDMDPEIAALLGTSVHVKKEVEIPDYADLFDSEGTDDGQEGLENLDEAEDLDLSSGGFPEISKRFEEIPHKAFDDPAYYKTALSNEGDIAQRVHGILQKFLNAKDPKDKGVFRQQFIPAYWEFLFSVARKAAGKLSDPKKYLLRFGILHPNFINQDVRTLFSQIIVENNLNQPVYYLDEWFKAVGTGVIRKIGRAHV